jgi:hypothetical protein
MEHKMKNALFLTIAILFSVVLLSTNVNAQTTGKGNSKAPKTNWVDKNGDGICDNVGTANHGNKGTGKGYGKKDGSGNPLSPADGTGFGKKGGKGNCTGVCDGTGSKGTMARKGQK